MKDSGTFVRPILPVDANNIVTIVDFNQILMPYREFEIDWIVSHAIILEDFQVKCGLFSLLEADWEQTNALASESSIQAEQARIKKDGQKIYLKIFHAYGNGPWIEKAEEILQNKNSLEQPWALMAPAFSTNETALIDEDLKIGVQVSSKAQGVGGLKGNDYLRIFGSWRKVTNFRKKKDDGVEALQSRIAALETLLNIFGAPSGALPGSSGLVPAPPASSSDFLLRGDRTWENPNKFATPAQITAAINALIGNSASALDTLAELGTALANDANFAATITNALNAKVGAADAGTITGQKTFSSPVVVSDTTAATSTTTGAHKVLGGQAIQGNQYVNGFSALGDASFPIKTKYLSGTTGASDGSVANLVHGLTVSGAASSAKILSVTSLLESSPGNLIQSNYTVSAGFQYDIVAAPSVIAIQLKAGNSANITNKPVRVLVVYTL